VFKLDFRVITFSCSVCGINRRQICIVLICINTTRNHNRHSCGIDTVKNHYRHGRIENTDLCIVVLTLCCISCRIVFATIRVCSFTRTAGCIRHRCRIKKIIIMLRGSIWTHSMSRIAYRTHLRSISIRECGYNRRCTGVVV